MLIHRPVRAGKVPLIAAGGHHKGVRQVQRTGKSVRFLRILNGYLPELAVGGNAVDIHISPQAGKAAGNAAGGKQGRYTVGGVALGDAAQINGAALIQRSLRALCVHMLRPHQRQ